MIDPTQLSCPYRLEDLAAQVVQRIGELEPQGPYYLGGWCRYGPLAYETARQLTAQGDEVALLTLIDSENPRYYRELPAVAKIAMRVQRLEYHLSNLTKSELADVPRYVRDRLRVMQYRLRELRVRVNHSLGRTTGGASVEELERILSAASVHYDPPPYTGRLTIFQSIERPRGRHWDLHAGWRHLTGGPVEVYDIPGDHESMLQEPHVRIFASRMRECLELEKLCRGQLRVEPARLAKTSIRCCPGLRQQGHGLLGFGQVRIESPCFF